MVRLTLRDGHLIGESHNGHGVEIPLHRVVIPQPADEFDGLGDFDVSQETYDAYCARQVVAAVKRADAAEMKLANVSAIFDRPLSKLKNKDLVLLIRTAQDALAGESEVMG